MRIERLFNALVLGGAAIGVSCGNGGASEQEPPAGSGSGGREGGASAPDSDAGGIPNVASGGMGAAGGAGATDVDAGGSLECSLQPSPSDPCGCACCWFGDCANDEPCCETFCESGDFGNGCCGS